MTAATTTGTTVPTTIGTTSNTTPLIPITSPEYDLAMLHDVGKSFSWPFEERLYSSINARGYPEVVKGGLVSQEQVDMAFQLFKHRFSSVLLAPFLLASTPSPSHPFVVTAILSHIPSMHSPLLTNAINDSLHHAMTGAVGLDVMLALLILSLQPATTGAATAVRLISLAYEMGAALGMEANVEAALRHPDQLCEPWWKSRLEEILLWEAVKVQYNIVHLGVSRFSTFKPSSAARFPNHPADNVRDAIRYLQAANSVVEVFRPYVEKLSRFEADGIYTTPNIQSLTTAWAAMDQRVEAARKQRMRFNMLERDVLLCHFAMSHRTVCCIAGLPRPFGPVEDKLNANQTAGHRMMLNGSILVDIWNKMDDGHLLTGHVILIIVIAIGCIRAVWATVNKQHPNLMGLDMDKVEKAAQKIHTMGGMGSSVLTRLSDAFARSFEHDSEACNNSVDQFLLDWGNPANWLDGDFASWSWLLTGQTNGDELPNGGGSSTI